VTQYLVVTQAPHYSYLNGGEGADARQPFLRYTQRTPNGARIASAIAGMSPGDFATVWADATGDIFTVRLPSTGATYNTRDWTPHGVWDATTEQALFGGRRGLTKLTAYSDLTGDWRELQQPSDLGRSVNGTVHYYGLIAKDADGNVYFGNVESLGRTWQFDPVTEEYTRLPDTPTTNGGNGASFSWCSDTGRLARYAGDAQKWMTLEPGVDSSWTTHTTGVGHGAHAIVRYHATHERHLIVGGTSTTTRASLITSAGTVTNVTAVPDTISMAEGSWVAAHPSGCWLVKTMDGAGTNKVYAAWPNVGLTDVTWVDLGTAPDTALTYPTLVPYSSSVALIAATTGLYAWALPNVAAPGGGTVAEVAAATDETAATLAAAASAVETASATDTSASTLAAAAAVAETASATDTTAGNLSGTYSASLADSAAAADTVSALLAAAATVSEDAAASDVCTAVKQGAYAAVLAEVAPVLDACSRSIVMAAALAESAAAVDAVSAALQGAAQPLSTSPFGRRLQTMGRPANVQTARRPTYRGGTR
jgi:hypothetical protein